MLNCTIKSILTITVCALLITATGYAKIDGIGIEDDQYAHMFCAAYLSEICQDQQLDLIQTTAIILGLSVLKESLDTHSTGFNTEDIGFSLSGVVLSFSIHSLFYPQSQPDKSE